MKNLALSFAFFVMGSFAFAQKQVTIKGGTIVPVEAVKNVRATEVQIGQNVDFKVLRDIIVDGIVAIPIGTIVKGNVYEAKRSTAFGTKGRLGIKLRYANLPSGEVVNFAGSDVYIQGKNRTALSVFVFILTCLPFPCGSKAELTTGIEYDASVANNTTVTIE